jgi:hypothetical protein
MPRPNLLWEPREQAELRAAKARFFRLLGILIALIAAIILTIIIS